MERMFAVVRSPVIYLLAIMGAAASDATESVQGERVLTAGQIDSSTVDVGACVVVIYGQGERHSVSGAWIRLDTTRGYIRAVDWEQRQLMLAREQSGEVETLGVDRIRTLTVIDADNAVQEDSLAVENGKVEKPPVLLGHRIANGIRDIRVLGGGKRAGERIFTKVVFGALSGAAFTAIGFGVIANIDDSSKDLTGPGYLLIGAAIGSSVGFPLGVTAVDPYDSLPMTLLAGVIPGAVGTDLIWDFHETGFLIAYVAPIICSLIASELWHQPPESRHVSFGLAPIFNGGLSAVTTLRF